MAPDETMERLRDGRLSRRRVLQALAAAGVVALPVSTFRSATAKAAPNTVDLSLLEWNGYENPLFHPEYTDRYGGEPKVAFFAEEEDALQRMRTGYPVDLVHFCAGMTAMARDAGVIVPLDTERIPRWGEIIPSLLEVEGIYAQGGYWLAPWDWGYSTVAYNPETIDVENPTYGIFIDPRFKGKTALPSSIGVNFFIAGVIGGWRDPLDPTEAELESAPEIFVKMLENARFVWSDSTQLEQAWAAGDVGISYVYGSATRRMRQEGMPNVVVEPLMMWICGLSLAADRSGALDQAYDYINAMLDPVGGVALFDVYGYGHANRKTNSLIGPERLAGTGLDDPVGLFSRGIFMAATPPGKRAKLFQLWFEAQAGLD